MGRKLHQVCSPPPKSPQEPPELLLSSQSRARADRAPGSRQLLTGRRQQLAEQASTLALCLSSQTVSSAPQAWLHVAAQPGGTEADPAAPECPADSLPALHACMHVTILGQAGNVTGGPGLTTGQSAGRTAAGRKPRQGAKRPPLPVPEIEALSESGLDATAGVRSRRSTRAPAAGEPHCLSCQVLQQPWTRWHVLLGSAG